MALFLTILMFCIYNGDAATPTGCTGDSSDSSIIHYTCDMTSIGGSISFAGFTDSEPQRLTIYSASGTVSAGTFSGFSAFSGVNSDYPATLQFLCTGSLTFSTGTFGDLGYFEEVFIKDCTTSLIASMFNSLGTANKVSISGGTLSTIDAGTFTSLDITPISTTASPRGELSIKNVVLTPGTFPSTFFDPLTNIKFIYLENLGLTSVDAAWFSSNTALVYLSLANNQITTLPSTIFDTTLALLYINLHGAPLDCTDTSTTWYYDYTVANNITFDGAAVCSTPAAEQYKSLAVWAQAFATSTDACNGEMGIVVGGSCIGLFQLICYCVTFVCLIFGIVALILVIYLRRSTLRAKQDNGRNGNQRKEKRKGGRREKRDSNAWT
ncbi:uncharacterized protein [Mytilus edulis]|uniref:uncharacterized protein isoform X1 n=1 Tax=Mytilus edulis TaxID=6550 RepID=UPI0039EFC453